MACGNAGGSVGPEGHLSAIAASDQRWVAVGSPETVLESRDGIRWAPAPISAAAGQLLDVAALDDLFVAVGYGRDANGQILTGSPDGTWQVNLRGENLETVVAGNGVFVSSGGVEPGAGISRDGVSWSKDTLVPADDWAGFDGSQFVVLFPDPFSSDRSLLTSTDAVTWTAVATPALAAPLRDISAMSVLGDQRLGFAVGQCADLATGAGCKALQLLSPADAPLSQLSVSPLAWPDRITAMASDGSTVVVTSIGAVYVTTLPIGSAPWEATALEDRDWVLSDIAYRDGLFVAVGNTASEDMLIISSANGRTWRRVQLD